MIKTSPKPGSDADQTARRRLRLLFAAAEEKRRPHEDELAEAFDLVKPIREWRPYRSRSRPDRTQMVDATLVRMARNLVTNTIRLLIPPNGQWAKLTGKTDVLEDKVQQAFPNEVRAANDKLFRHFIDSNFYLATTEALYDGIIGGTFGIMFNDQEGEPLNYLAVPSDELFFLESHDGNVDTVFRRHDLTARQIVQRFGEDNVLDSIKRALSENPTRKFCLLESVVPDGDGFEHRVSLGESDSFEKITDSQRCLANPFVVARWERMLGHVWGNSPVRDALQHQRVANAIRSDILKFGSFVAGGLWQVNDETVNTENLSGKLLPGSVIATDEPLQPVPFPGQFNLTFGMLDAEREAMKHLMFDSTPPSEDALKYMNDVAVSFLRQEFLSQVGEPAQRLQREYLQPIADQALGRLMVRGEIKSITPEQVRRLNVEGVSTQQDLFRVDVNAAIQRAQAAQEAQEIASGVSTAQQIFGPQQIALHVDVDKATRKTLIGLGVPEDMLRSGAAVKRIKDQQESEQEAQLAFSSLLAQSGIAPQPTRQVA